ncbi:MAG TPA: GTP-binding protein [Kofleriaceae bacterium]|nr:GTP-binding protein [Kofleriaceae bacterium]
MARVPFTILTGWLGAGKTSALNRMLAATHGKRIAVLVNELGRISIDTQLIVGRGGDVLELAGGCVCCKVDTKNDLWDGIGDIVTRSSPDCVVLETTGIAEPAAILDGLVRVKDSVRERILPAGVICVVDAEAGGAALDRREEAREQAQSADRVLLSKLDVASPDAVRRTHALLDTLAPSAERASFPRDDAGARAMTAWITEPRRLVAWRERPHAHDHDHGAHHHAGQLVAIAFSDDAPLVGERVLAVVESLGDRLVRAKGFVHLAGDERRGFVERAGIRTELRHLEPWGDAPRRTELVLIGDDLDEAAVHRALWACRAGA